MTKPLTGSARRRALIEVLRQPLPPRTPCYAAERFLQALLARAGGTK
jgi:hypothetical protein